MRAKITKEKLEEIQKYIETKDEESLSKFKSELLFGDWELEEVKTEPTFAKYEPRPTITADASSTPATATHTRTIKISPATLSTISTTEEVLEEFQRIYKSWELPSTEARPFLTTSLFEQIPSLIIKDTLETLIATDIKDKIKYYVNKSPVLDTTSICLYYHFFKVAIDGYREKVRKFHLSVDRIQNLYLQTVHVSKKEAEEMFNYIFIDVAEDLAEFQYKSDQFLFAIWDQLPYYASESSKYKKPYKALWEGIKDKMLWEDIKETERCIERHAKGEEDPASLEARRALDDDAESAWRRFYTSKWEW